MISGRGVNAISVGDCCLLVPIVDRIDSLAQLRARKLADAARDDPNPFKTTFLRSHAAFRYFLPALLLLAVYRISNVLQKGFFFAPKCETKLRRLELTFR
jgi:hypothetical protein